jgi:hypothetical protein
MTTRVFWDVALCRWMSSSSSSSSSCSNIDGDVSSNSSSSNSMKLRRVTLKMKELISFEISRITRPLTRRQIPEDSKVPLRLLENLCTVKIYGVHRNMWFDRRGTACCRNSVPPLLYPEDGGSGSVYQSTRRHSSAGCNHDCSKVYVLYDCWTYPEPTVNCPTEKRGWLLCFNLQHFGHEGTAVCTHTMKAYRGSRGIAPPILNVGTG